VLVCVRVLKEDGSELSCSAVAAASLMLTSLLMSPLPPHHQVVRNQYFFGRDGH